jgi:predicted anti-sigma-YlaC factor YlaD
MRHIMECQEVREQLSSWLDGEFDETAGALLSAHLEGCAACQLEWCQLMALETALGSLAVPMPAGLAEKVLAQVRPPRRRQWWQSVALAACLVLGIALGGSMARTFYAPAGSSHTEAEVASLEVFQDYPQGSLGTIVASYQPDDSNGISQ